MGISTSIWRTVKNLQFFNYKKRILNRNGQAVVEYMLLVVITIALILGLKNVFSNVNDFMNAYIGDYVVCLMEYGELPELGVGDSDQKKHTSGSGRSCNERFANFNFASGRPPIGSGAGQVASGSSSGKKKSTTDSDSSTDSKRSNSENRESGRRQTRSAKRASPYSGGQISRSGGYGTADGDPDFASRRVRVIAVDDSLEKNRERYSTSTYQNLRSSGGRYKAISGELAAQIEKNSGKKPLAVGARVRSIAVESESRLGPQKRLFTPPSPALIEEKSDGNSEFSLGGMMRWMIIIAMVLGIIIFFGGQVLNYSNSKD